MVDSPGSLVIASLARRLGPWIICTRDSLLVTNRMRLIGRIHYVVIDSQESGLCRCLIKREESVAGQSQVAFGTISRSKQASSVLEILIASFIRV